MGTVLPLLLLGGLLASVLPGQPGAQSAHGGNLSQAQPYQPGTAEGGYLQGLIANFMQDAGAAQAGYLAALGADDGNRTVRLRALEAAMANGDMDTAERLAKTLTSADQPMLVRLLLFTAAVRDGNLPEARRHLRALQDKGAHLTMLHALEAYLALAEGVGIEKVLPLVTKTPGWPGQWHSARLLLRAGQDDAALAFLREKAPENPGALPLQRLLHQLELRLGNDDRAAARQQAFALANPTLAPLLPPAPLGERPAPIIPTLADDVTATLLEATLTVWAEGVPSLALQLGQMALRMPTSDPFLHALALYYVGLLQEAGNTPHSARASYEALLQCPQPGFVLLAQIRLHEMAFQQAASPREKTRIARDSAQLAAHTPTLVAPWQSAAQLLMNAEQFAEAAQAFDHLLTLTPETAPLVRANLLFARGAAHDFAGRDRAAEADLQAALVLDPAHADALNHLGYMWVEEAKNLEQAYPMLKRAHLLAPSSGAITDSVGWAYYKLGDYETARGYLELALELEPGVPEILSHLGDTYYQLGNETEAQKLWQRALTLADQGADVPQGSFLRDLQRKVRRGAL